MLFDFRLHSWFYDVGGLWRGERERLGTVCRGERSSCFAFFPLFIWGVQISSSIREGTTSLVMRFGPAPDVFWITSSYLTTHCQNIVQAGFFVVVFLQKDALFSLFRIEKGIILGKNRADAAS